MAAHTQESAPGTRNFWHMTLSTAETTAVTAAVAAVVGALVNGWWQTKSKKLETDAGVTEAETGAAATIRLELDKSLLNRIDQLDKRVAYLEQKHEEDLEKIRTLTVQAEVNRVKIETLEKENAHLQAQLACPLDVCPYVPKNGQTGHLPPSIKDTRDAKDAKER